MNSSLNRRQFIKTSTTAAVAAAILPSAIGQSDKKIQVALVGAAHIHAPGFADILKQRKDVAVKSVGDHDAARARKYASQLGGKEVSELQRIWSDPELAAVVIHSETNRHPHLAL